MTKELKYKDKKVKNGIGRANKTYKTFSYMSILLGPSFVLYKQLAYFQLYDNHQDKKDE